MAGATEALRVGVIGVGRIGAIHARTLASLPSVGEVVLADAELGRAKAVAAELGAGTATVDELFEARDVDALAIATPTAGHAPLVVRAARAGLPTFCEKPVALDLDVLDEVRDEVDRTGALVQVGFQRRFDPGYRAAHEAVAAGEVGTLLVLRAATHDPVPPPEAYIATSGGIFRDLHVHDFDAVRFVTGREIVEVYADGAVRETEWFAEHGDVDVAVAVLRLDDGSLAILSGTRHDPRGYDVRLEVFGTRESLVVGVDERAAYRSVEPGAAPPGRGWPTFVERFATAYRAELAAFVECVRTGRPAECTLADTRAALAAALAADRSRAERRPVALEEVTSGATSSGSV
jgi:myo-inositol 2-dehydrogenase/D-chiro-inositol 1-dehydrogenase